MHLLRRRTTLPLLGLGLVALLTTVWMSGSDDSEGPPDALPTPTAVAPTSSPSIAATQDRTAESERPSPRDASTWRTDQVMVVPADGADIAAIAAAHGSSVLRAPGRAHLATLAVPEGVDRDTFL